jgi:hypothetical protein
MKQRGKRRRLAKAGAPVENGHDIVWGAAAIAEVINTEPRQVFYLVQQGRLPGVRKAGRRLVGSRRQILDGLLGGGTAA